MHIPYRNAKLTRLLKAHPRGPVPPPRDPPRVFAQGWSSSHHFFPHRKQQLGLVWTSYFRGPGGASDCLGGTSITSIICTIGPCDKYNQETAGAPPWGHRWEGEGSESGPQPSPTFSHVRLAIGEGVVGVCVNVSRCWEDSLTLRDPLP